MYSLIKTKLGPLSDKLEWLANIKGSKLNGESASDWHRDIIDALGGVTSTILGTNNSREYFKLGQIPNTNQCIFTAIYPDSDTGFAWTIAFYTAPCNATQGSHIGAGEVWKIRFDNP